MPNPSPLEVPDGLTVQEALEENRLSAIAESGGSEKLPVEKNIETLAEDLDVGYVVLEQIGGASPVEVIRALDPEINSVIYVTYSGLSEHREAARAAGAVVVKMRGDNQTPHARCRNAGFRQLRKVAPTVKYVQFLEGDSIQNPAWITDAIAFMEKRPEISGLQGLVSNKKEKNIPLDHPRYSDYEIQTTGNDVLVRVKSFIDIGGFRGDLMIADVQDFCLRSRGRGRHIWQLKRPMVAKTGNSKKQNWWKRKKHQGFEHAYSAALHGVPPERYRVTEMRRAVLWGGAFPVILATLFVGVAVLTYLLVPFSSPLLTALFVPVAGAAVYFLKALIFSFRRPDGTKIPLLESLMETCAHFPEFFGVMKFLGWRRRQAKKTLS